MKVLGLNSSARSGGESKTDLMLNHLVNGMRGAGADVETVNLREKNIKKCVGCFTCMTKTPGKCVLKDDMTRDLFPKWLESDLVIYATPLFHHTVNATMKTFIERTWPICEPFLVEKEGRWFHPLRRKHPGVVVLSVCGFPAMSAFGALTHYVKFLYEAQEKGMLWAEIYRPGAEYMIYRIDKQKDILDATIQAGKELVETRRVSPETLARIEQPLTNNVSDFAKIANCWWKTCIAEGITLKKFADEDMIPRPDSVETFFLLMTTGFDPEAAGDIKATLQFEFTGRVENSCYFIIADGTINAKEGKSERPNLIIKTPFEVWMDIVTGKADGAEMFMEGKYEAEGNIGSLNNIFLSATSFGTMVKTSPIRIAPRAISSSIKRFLIMLVRKMISSTVSFSRISNCVFTFTRNNFRNIGESQGLIKSGSRLFLAKLKNASRLVNRARFVWGLRPSVS